VALDPQAGPPAQAEELSAPRAHARIAFLFLRSLGAIHMIAFLSLGVQVDGLLGSRGILPAAELLAFVDARTDATRYWLMPTLFWLGGASDGALRGACWYGVALGALLALGIAPLPALLGLWALYLSLATVGQVFLGYQWDGLLLETTLLALFIAPLGWRPRPREPAAPALWLLRFLLFRLLFASGLAKLASGDDTWRSLTALTYHYETQPLPTWIGWYVHQLPSWLHQASCALMFGAELLLPFLALGPRRARLVAFAPLVGLQLAIAATGNYTFFNLLTIALCLLLLDDGVLLRRPGLAPAAVPRPWVVRAQLAGAAGLTLLAFVPFLGSIVRLPWPGPLLTLYRAAAPFRSVNPYGLFAVMTTERPEIVVEGSLDGVEWRPYAFRYKPGDPKRAPAFVAPHQPRLDWQMWFAALEGRCERAPWFLHFVERLKAGSPPVLGLLEGNPFPEGPPAQVRARLQDYRFTTWAERARTGEYWRSADDGVFCPDVPSSLALSPLAE
jgi:hypothetical protein